MEEKILFWEALFVISPVPARKNLFKVTNWSTRIRWEHSSRLKMTTLEWCHWRRSIVFLVNFVLIIDFEEANVYWGHAEKINTIEDKIRYIMRYVVPFQVWAKFINKKHLELYHHNPTGESVRNFCEGIYFRWRFCLKRCSSHLKWPAIICLFIDFVHWKLIRSYWTQLILSY